MIKNKDLKRRILEISYKNKLSHIGSCLTAVDIIDEIYSKKKCDDKFILSSGHAGLALYVVLEKYYTSVNSEYLFNKHGVHPNRDTLDMLHCSTGSLGQGITVAVGMAVADRSKNVYCLISDGEMAEGSIYESLNVIAYENIKNLIVYFNWNNWAAYRKTFNYQLNWDNLPMLDANQKITSCDYLPFLTGQDAHYHIMTEDEYKLGMEILK